jgi:hypothetical protein
MIREKYLVSAFVIIAFTVVAFPYYQAYNLQLSTTDQKPASSPLPMQASPSFSARPSGVNVTILGVMKASVVAPTCSLSNPPCAISPTSIYYVVVNGRNYRLIFPNSTSVPGSVMGSNVVITGLYITPSTFNVDEWTPSLSFYGDIYVQKVTYFLQLPH